MERKPLTEDKVLIVTTISNNKNKIPLIGETGVIVKVYNTSVFHYPYVIDFDNPNVSYKGDNLCWDRREFVLLDSDNMDYKKE